MANQVNIESLNGEIIQGNSPSLLFSVYNKNGTPYNLSDVTNIKYVIAESLELRTPLVEKSLTGDGITIIDADQGKVKVDLEASDTQSLYGNYIHELVIIFSDGNVYTVTNSRNDPGKLTVRRALATAD